MKKKSILNIGAGKDDFNHEKNVNYFVVNIDKSYYNNSDPVLIEKNHILWCYDKIKNKTFYVKKDIFEFLERYKYKFNFIKMYRFFEHINRDKLLYFIYLLSTAIEVGGIVDVIAPDYQLLAQHILNENPYDKDFDKHDIIVSTEMFNEISDPHQNITTPRRIEKLFEHEGRFEVEKVFQPYSFDGRRIYFRSLIKRI